METILEGVEINEDFIPNHNITYNVRWDNKTQLFHCIKNKNVAGWVAYEDAPKIIKYKLTKPVEDFTETEKMIILDYRGLTLVDGFEYSDIFMEKSYIELVEPNNKKTTNMPKPFTHTFQTSIDISYREGTTQAEKDTLFENIALLINTNPKFRCRNGYFPQESIDEFYGDCKDLNDEEHIFTGE